MSLSFTKKIVLFLMVFLSIPVMNCFSEANQSNKDIIYKMYREYQKSFTEVAEISSEDAIKELNDGKILFVDVRTDGEMSVSMLPKAISKVDFLGDTTLYKNKTIVAYCTIGYRSGLFAAEMKKKGVTVLNLSAGILGWIHEGGKVYDSRGIVKRLHVYGKDWDYAPEGFDTVIFGLFEKLLN